MTQGKGDDLKPCPFCGSEAQLLEDPDDSGPRVNCIGCDMEGPRAYWVDYEDKSWAFDWAVESWNTRAAPALPPAPEIEALVERLRVVCPDTTEDAVTVCEAATALQSQAAETARLRAMCEELAGKLVIALEALEMEGVCEATCLSCKEARAVLAQYQESKGEGR